MPRIKYQYYFAYGSNLCQKSMARRCPAAQPIIGAELADWRMVFRGVADVEPSPGRVVVGAVWQITRDCEEALDRYEGFDPLSPAEGFYRKEYVDVVGADGDTYRCLMYVMNYTYADNCSLPSSGYFSTIVRGFRDFGLAHEELSRSMQDTYERVHGKGITEFMRVGEKRLRGVVVDPYTVADAARKVTATKRKGKKKGARQPVPAAAVTTRSGHRFSSLAEQRKHMSPATRLMFDREQKERAEARRQKVAR